MSILQDVRYATRLLRRHPTSAAAAIVALALGIGGTTAIFSVVRAVLLKPLPYHAPERLVMVAEPRTPHPTFQYEPYRLVITGAEIEGIRERAPIFEDFAAVELWSTNRTSQQVVSGEGDVERLRGGLATANFFDVLGVSAAVGRTFQSGDADADVVVLSDGLATRRYGGAAAAMGRTVRLDGRPRTVIGVLPRLFRFTYPKETEFWVPLAADILVTRRTFALTYHLVGRLRDGVTVEQASAALGAIGKVSDRFGRSQSAGTLLALPIHDWMVGQVRPALALVSGISAVLLGIACGNVALLLLARSVGRSRELALRAALGASRARLSRQVIAECGVVGLAGAAGGVLVAAIALPLIKRIVPPTVPRIDEMTIDGWALLVALAAGVLSVLVCVPGALRARASAHPQQVLHHAGPTTAGNRQVAWWRRAMLAGQVGLVLVLLAGGSLLLRSFVNLLQTNLGYDPSTLLAMRLQMPSMGTRSEPGEWRRVQEGWRAELVPRIRALPGVRDVAISSTIPFEGYDGSSFLPQAGPRYVDRGATSASGSNSSSRSGSSRGAGQGGGASSSAAARGEAAPSEPQALPRTPVNSRPVGPNFFQIMRIPVIEGRAFTNDDTAQSPKVMILSRALAARLFPKQSAIGQRIPWGEPYEIVGVVEDVRWRRPDEPAVPAMYLADAQERLGVLNLIVRTDLPAAALTPLIRTTVREFDASQPVDDLRALSAIVDDARAERRFYATAAATFGLLAVMLASVGLYGAVAASVAERLREIGVRMALGAGARDVIRLMLRQGLAPVLLGLGLGGVASFWGLRLLRGFLFGVSPLDPVTFVAVPALLLAVALAATYLPARRALRVDPAIVLRQD